MSKIIVFLRSSLQYNMPDFKPWNRRGGNKIVEKKVDRRKISCYTILKIHREKCFDGEEYARIEVAERGWLVKILAESVQK